MGDERAQCRSELLSSKTDAVPVSRVARLEGLTRLPSPAHSGEIACSACHREHHGSQNDLTTLTDQQCQVCHQNVYHSFESDHPPLGDYPLKRRSRIAFDHNSHAVKHFADAKQAFDCATCHVTDSQNNVQVLVSFEQACAECHQQKIDVLSEPGLTLLALPTLDMTAIESQGTNVGSWPLAATGDFDGVLPPLMRLLLLADPQAKEVLLKRDDQFDFSDLNPEVPQDITDGVSLTWSIKRLVFELARDGRSAISRRIKIVTGVELDSQQLTALTNSLEANVFQNSANRWLPDLQDEVSDQVPVYEASLRMHSAVNKLKIGAAKKFVWNDDTSAALAKAFGDVSGQDQTLQSQPPRDGSAWLAINPLAGTASQSASETNSSEAANGDERLAEQPTEQSMSLDSNQQSQENVAGFVAPQGDRENSVWLVENPLASKSGSPKTNTPVKSPIQQSPKSSQPTLKEVTISKSPTGAPIVKKLPVWDQEQTVLVGWVRDDLRFQLRYQPAGHADKTLKSWIDFAGQVPTAKTESRSGPLFDLLLANEGLGDCRRCHTADQQPNGELKVNWQPEYRDPSVASFTRFSHGPHLTLPQLRDCEQCHQLDPEHANQKSFVGFDPHQFQSNFADLETSDCAACHRDGSASNSCTQCHSYHVGMRCEK